jgi:hypothetical protein
MNMPVKKRLVLITLLGAAGAALFIPFLLAGSSPDESTSAYIWPGLAGLAAALTFACAWAGLKLADRADLPMSVLRDWELGKPRNSAVALRILAVSAFSGMGFGLATSLLVRKMGIPPNPGSLAVRLVTIPFAAIVPETSCIYC